MFARILRAATRAARRILGSLDNKVFVSAASAWVLATNYRLGRLEEAADPPTDFPIIVRQMGFTELPATVEHGQWAGMLPGTHKDPVDRMLIVQAQAENVSIVSSDGIFDELLVSRIW